MGPERTQLKCGEKPTDRATLVGAKSLTAINYHVRQTVQSIVCSKGIEESISEKKRTCCKVLN